MRPTHWKQLVAQQVNEIPRNDPRWIVHDLVASSFLDFELRHVNANRRYRFWLTLAEYDLEPPSLWLIDEHARPIKDVRRWPPEPFRNRHPHPIVKRPWVCRPGLWEYHHHHLHENDPWDLHRNSTRLVNIIERLANDLNHVRYQ